MRAFSLEHRHTGEQNLLYTCVIIKIETALYFCLFQMITILQIVLIHEQLFMTPISYTFPLWCVITVKRLNLFLNASPSKSTNQLLFLYVWIVSQFL